MPEGIPTGNLFRFISVRPPEPLDSEDRPVLDKKQVADDVIDRVRKKQKNERLPLEIARARVGDEIISSRNYYSTAPVWQALRFRWPKFRRLLENALKEPHRDDFLVAMEGALSETAEDRLDLLAWIKSEHADELKMTLWVSYYANVLSPWRRPVDREELTGWIKVFHLLDAALIGNGAFTRAARVLPEARPAIPDVLFVPLAEFDVEQPEAPAPEPVDQIQDYEQRLERLELAREQLDAIRSSKLARIQQIELVEEHPKSRKPEERKGETPEFATGRPAGMVDPPWRLTEADIEHHELLQDVLRELRVHPTIDSIPDAISHIEETIATELSALVNLVEQETLVGAGPTFIRIRRSDARLGLAEVVRHRREVDKE